MTIINVIIVQKLITENKIIVQKMTINDAMRMTTKKKQIIKNK